MCGRYTLHTPGRRVAECFGLAGEPPLRPRYNIAPTQPVPVVRVLRANPATKGRELVPLRWGLVPPWADDPSIGNRMINARAETVAGKLSFRAAFRRRVSQNRQSARLHQEGRHPLSPCPGIRQGGKPDVP